MDKLTLKRINGDLKHFTKENPKYFDVYPNPDNMLEIYFLLDGREDTLYEGGQYVGKIVHSPDYPRKAPDYYIFTPNGRFEVNKKICLTNSGFHQADWAPAAWNLVTLLEGLSSVWHSDIKEDKIGIGHMVSTHPDIIKEMAVCSSLFNSTQLSNIYFKFNKIKK
jgi:ubiquitin-protein ligase